MPGFLAPASLATIEPAEGYWGDRFAEFEPRYPVSIQWAAAKWSPLSWYIDRMIAILSISRAWSGKQLGDLYAGNARVHRLERAAELDGRVGLGVVGLVLGRSAVEPDQDHRAIGKFRWSLLRGNSAGPQQVRQAQGRSRQAERRP